MNIWKTAAITEFNKLLVCRIPCCFSLTLQWHCNDTTMTLQWQGFVTAFTKRYKSNWCKSNIWTLKKKATHDLCELKCLPNLKWLYVSLREKKFLVFLKIHSQASQESNFQWKSVPFHVSSWKWIKWALYACPFTLGKSFQVWVVCKLSLMMQLTVTQSAFLSSHIVVDSDFQLKWSNFLASCYTLHTLQLYL